MVGRSFIFLVYLFLVIGCRSVKTPRVAPERSITEILNAIFAHNQSFHHWSASISADGTTPEFSGKVQLKVRMTIDSLVWIQAKKLGIEALRARITPEITTLIFRLERLYVEKSTDAFASEYRMRPDFSRIQQMFAGNIPTIDSVEVIDFVKTKEGYKLDGTLENYRLTYTVDPFTLKVHRLIISESDGRSVDIQFLNYKTNKEGVVYASERKVTIFDGQDTMFFRLELDDVEYDIIKNTPFEVPSHYERVD